MVNVAMPALSVPVPRVVPLSAKVTVPLGVPVPGATARTVAVNVTAPPTCAGFQEEATAVDVVAMFTVCVAAEEVLDAKLELPP